VTAESAKPSAVCAASRLPAQAGGAASATRAENRAESGMIVSPQSTSSKATSAGGPPKLAAVATPAAAENHTESASTSAAISSVSEAATAASRQPGARDARPRFRIGARIG
jgi:hypothetical protein